MQLRWRTKKTSALPHPTLAPPLTLSPAKRQQIFDYNKVYRTTSAKSQCAVPWLSRHLPPIHPTTLPPDPTLVAADAIADVEMLAEEDRSRKEKVVSGSPHEERQPLKEKSEIQM